LSNAVWILGYPDQARRIVQQAFDGTARIDHPGSILQVHSVAGMEFAALQRDFISLEQRVDTVIAFAKEHRLRLTNGRYQFYRGLVLFEHGMHADGLALLEGSFPDLFHRPHDKGTLFLNLLANAYSRSGQLDRASEIIASTLAMVERTAEHTWEAEIHRVAAEILLARGASVVAIEEELRQAIDIARRQDAKSFELRATMSLAHLLSDQGRRSQARNLLEQVYVWFTEGFDTPDLQEARVLLTQLGET
ncbi:MAG TPA: tetratricopeptide repeat protein, partial [Bryobacteraceae bacterium]|nr:tetratricopeptide repeat protein [Bryobacteraceae bacterium]